jgi:hypothetical protein
MFPFPVHFARPLLIGCAAAFAGFVSLALRGVVTTHRYPLPHHVPKYPGGISLRFAMIHDAIHERYPRHGKAYYEERNRLALARIRKEEGKQPAGGKPSERYYALTDDLAVGLERLGDHAGAVDLMRKKLAKQEATGLTGSALYTTYANLGTFLIHQQMAAGVADRSTAKKRLREGLDFVRKSIAVNPEAHFGREEWQANAVEYLLASLDDPGLVLRYDLVGDRLDEENYPTQVGRVRRHSGWAGGGGDYVTHQDLADREELPADRRESLRGSIPTVGVEEGWPKAVPGAHRAPVPFDEPCLGILGMWRYGGGANPYFAVTFGETMLRVGQRYIAWDAYERATALADRLGNRDTAAKFVAHCRARQAAIEQTLPGDEVPKLRPAFDAELAFGRRYQEAYQAYEAARIRDGASLDDPHFYDAFEAEHGSVASPVGPEDVYVAERPGRGVQMSWQQFFAPAALPGAVLAAGVVGFVVACVCRVGAWARAGEPRGTGSGPASGTIA